ncbi:MAG: hypothetical protein U1F29_09045 [Planctomycetota bacterium]
MRRVAREEQVRGGERLPARLQCPSSWTSTVAFALFVHVPSNAPQHPHAAGWIGKMPQTPPPMLNHVSGLPTPPGRALVGTKRASHPLTVCAMLTRVSFA